MTKRFFIYLCLLIISLTVILFIADKNLVSIEPRFTWWLLPVLFFAVSASGHSLMVRSIKSKPDQFMIWFLLAITVKMLLYLALLLIWYVISGQKLTVPFVGAFALMYIAVTTLDLITILNISKNQK